VVVNTAFVGLVPGSPCYLKIDPIELSILVFDFGAHVLGHVPEVAYHRGHLKPGKGAML
jgi:hypothetical protein